MTNYKEMKYQQLQSAAKAKGLTIFGVKKPDLIKLLEDTEKIDDFAEEFVEDVHETEEEGFDEVDGEFNPDKAELLTPEKPKPAVKETREKPVEIDDSVQVKHVEPKILQKAPNSEEVKEVKLVGDADPTVLLNDFLIERGISMKELNSAVSAYFNDVNPARNVTIGSIRYLVSKGEEEARKIDATDKVEVNISDIYVADALRAIFGWKPIGRTKEYHILKR